jgi:hypothetical protein
MTKKQSIHALILSAILLNVTNLHSNEETSRCSIPTQAEEKKTLFYSSRSPVELDITLGFDQFRSLPEGSWSGNSGAFAAANIKIPLPLLFSTQLGGSFGLYDWNGRSSTQPKDSKPLQQQGFLTVAASRQTGSSSGFNAGLAYDWMLNKNFGLFATNPFFDQIRGQFGYLFKGGNEIGVWGTYGIHTSHLESQQVPLKFRGISQVNLFWCHYFKTLGYAMLWAGTPYRRGLMYSSGRPGQYLVGAQFSAPMTHSLSIEGHAVYMGSRNGSGIVSAKNNAANISIAITYAFGKRKMAQSPYMNLANNSNFIADTNQNF